MLGINNMDYWTVFLLDLLVILTAEISMPNILQCYLGTFHLHVLGLWSKTPADKQNVDHDFIAHFGEFFVLYYK